MRGGGGGALVRIEEEREELRPRRRRRDECRQGVVPGWMAKRGAIGDLGAVWLYCHGFSVTAEALGLFSRVRRAAPSLQMQSEAPVVASYGAAKTATFGHRCRTR